MKSDSRYLTFLYHDVVNNPSDSGFQRDSAKNYKHNVIEFYNNIDIIVRKRDNIIKVDNIDSFKNATLLTFDDGGKSALLIAKYLEKFDLRGHFFITTSLIGDKYFLTEAEIRDLHKRGHIIGSHSHSHPNVFSSLSYELMKYEWSTSKSILEEILETEVKYCSIPGGDANKDSYLAAQESGYEIVFDSEPVTELRRLKNLIIIGRVCPKAGTGYKRIEGYCDFKGIKKQYYLRKIKVAIKFIIFPIYSKIHNSRRHGK